MESFQKQRDFEQKKLVGKIKVALFGQRAYKTVSLKSEDSKRIIIKFW